MTQKHKPQYPEYPQHERLFRILDAIFVTLNFVRWLPANMWDWLVYVCWLAYWFTFGRLVLYIQLQRLRRRRCQETNILFEYKQRVQRIKREERQCCMWVCPFLALSFALCAWYALAQHAYPMSVLYAVASMIFLAMLLVKVLAKG